MDWKRVLIMTGSACAFLAVVAAGAIAIVSLAPGERPGASEENALLMENTPALRPFDEPPPPRPAPPARADRTLLAERPAPVALPTAVPAERPAQGRPSPEEVQSEWTNAPPPPLQAPRPPPRVAAVAPPPAVSPPAIRQPATPPAPLPSLRPPERRVDGVLTPSEIRRIRVSLRLTAEQTPYWVPVEQALMEIGTQQAAMVRAGQDPKDAFGVGAAMRMYSVARPLIGVLRDDQKAQIRERARAMGFGNAASSL